MPVPGWVKESDWASAAGIATVHVRRHMHSNWQGRGLLKEDSSEAALKREGPFMVVRRQHRDSTDWTRHRREGKESRQRWPQTAARRCRLSDYIHLALPRTRASVPSEGSVECIQDATRGAKKHLRRLLQRSRNQGRSHAGTLPCCHGGLLEGACRALAGAVARLFRRRGPAEQQTASSFARLRVGTPDEEGRERSAICARMYKARNRLRFD